MGGAQQRVHPSDGSGHARAASLDWPGRVPECKAAEEPLAPGGNADALAAVRVRSKASVGELTGPHVTAETNKICIMCT